MARPASQDASDPRPPSKAACPRCGAGFECGAASGHCACFDLVLTDALRASLAARYSACLCLTCLRELADGARSPRTPGAD